MSPLGGSLEVQLSPVEVLGGSLEVQLSPVEVFGTTTSADAIR